MQAGRLRIQDAVYAELKSAIMELRFLPGQSMSTQEIATKLNVSRTPVREAFLRLEKDGLVISIAQKATVVSKIDLGRLDQEWFIRNCLEIGVAKDYIEHSTLEMNEVLRKIIEKQKKAMQEKNQNNFIEFDNEFHATIFKIADRELAWQTIQNTNGHYNRFRRLIVQDQDVVNRNIEEHENIFRAFEAKNLDDAKLCIAEHFRRKAFFDREKVVKLYADYVCDNRFDEEYPLINKL